MAWNAVNDPLFGFASDAGVSVTSILKSCCSRTFGGNGELQAKSKNRSNAARAKREPYADVQRSRLNIISMVASCGRFHFYLCGCPMRSHDSTFGFGGLLPSASQKESPRLSGFHFVVSMCMYDDMLTLVEVNHSALLADLTTSSDEEQPSTCTLQYAGASSLSSFLVIYAGNHPQQPRCCLFNYAALLLLYAQTHAFSGDVCVVRCGFKSISRTALKSGKVEKRRAALMPSDVSAFVKQMLKHRNTALSGFLSCSRIRLRV